MQPTNYKAFWDHKASTKTGAFLAVDGSSNEEVARLTGAYTARQVECALALDANDRVFELGCGVGRIGMELAPKVAHWQGADISANMLGVARERLADMSNVGFTELSNSSLRALADGSFSKAYCVAVFIHMDKEDFLLYLEELARVLEPGGLLFFDTWNLAHPIGWRRFALEVRQYRGVDLAQRKDVARNQFATPEEVRIYLEHCGFELLQMYTDSPWVQSVAMKRGGNRDVAAERARLQRDASRIAYPPLWTELFDAFIRVTDEGQPPQAMVDALGEDSRGEEIAMFRIWYREFWRLNEAHWGPPPASLG